MVLFAQEELRVKLANAKARNLRSRIVMASTLERLTAQEVADMVAFRWGVASGGGRHPFSEAALQALFEHSEGMPREATILADNALLLGYYRKEPVIGKEIIDLAAKDRDAGLARGGP